MERIDLSILLMPNGIRGYYAQVLEHDLAADGRDLDAALHELARVFNVHCAACMKMGMKPFESLAPAPKKYHALYATATPINKTLTDLRA